MKNEPYLASADSAFMRDVLRGYHGESCLEIGAGNAGNLVELAERFRFVVGTDLVRPSMEDWKEKGANFVLADVSSCLVDSCVDLVAFNPPYLSEGGTGDPATEAGTSHEIPKSFLAGALRVVRPGGRVVMLLNGEANIQEMQRELVDRGFNLKRVGVRKLFFEELAIYEASAAV